MAKNKQLEDIPETPAQRTRRRLARAGLLTVPDPNRRQEAYAATRVAEARRAASSGTPLSTIVAEDRG